MKCQARQHSDQMICHKCGLVWDMNDPDPPVCRRDSTAFCHSATSESTPADTLAVSRMGAGNRPS